MSLGMGVMIRRLRGDSPAEAVAQVIGQRLVEATLDKANEALCLRVRGGTLRIVDDGQSCCESRYITCDDDLASFAGAEVQSIEVAAGPDIDTGYGVHEQQFLRVITDRGVITCCTHNEHNGYYGGFALSATFVAAEEGA